MTDALSAMAEAIRRLGQGFGDEVAREASQPILAAVKATADAGTTPDGSQWKARKSDGAKALAGVSEHITVKVTGSVIQLRLPYPYSVWHYTSGTATRPRRQVLPDADKALPQPVEAAIRAAAERVFRRRSSVK